MIKLVLEFETRAALLEFLGQAPTPTPVATAPAQEPEPTPAPAPRKAKVKTAPAPELDLNTVELSGEALPPAEPEPALEYQQIADAILSLAKTKGRDAAVNLLAQFGAAKLTDLDKAHWPAIYAAAQL